MREHRSTTKLEDIMSSFGRHFSLIGREGLVPISAPAFLVQRRHPRVFSKLKGLLKFRSVFENMETGFSNLEILQEPESREDQMK